MADIEKGLVAGGSHLDGRDLDQRSRISDDSSHDLEKRYEAEKTDPAPTDGPEQPGAPKLDANLVNWNGPDDPEFPQNLYVLLPLIDM